MFKCSNAQMLLCLLSVANAKCSNAQTLKCSDAHMLKCSNAQMLKRSNAQTLKRSNACATCLFQIRGVFAPCKLMTRDELEFCWQSKRTRYTCLPPALGRQYQIVFDHNLTLLHGTTSKADLAVASDPTQPADVRLVRLATVCERETLLMWRHALGTRYSTPGFMIEGQFRSLLQKYHKSTTKVPLKLPFSLTDQQQPNQRHTS